VRWALRNSHGVTIAEPQGEHISGSWPRAYEGAKSLVIHVPTGGLSLRRMDWTTQESGQLPTVLALDGDLADAALWLVRIADLIVAVPAMSFIDTGVDVGGEPAAMALVKRLPQSEVARMALLRAAGPLSSVRAHALGCVDELVLPGQSTLQTAVAWAQTLPSLSSD
jgi:enoyl-CoA hydratase/carnithine racemase